jgi:hypothetical protein
LATLAKVADPKATNRTIKNQSQRIAPDAERLTATIWPRKRRLEAVIMFS